METTEDRPAYLAMAEQMTGPVSVTELADVQHELDAEQDRHAARDAELRIRRNALIARAMLDNERPDRVKIPTRDLVGATKLTPTQLGRIRDGKASGRTPSSAPPGRRPAADT